MNFKYLLFDLDGTLTDPKEGITTSVQYALRAFGIEEPDRNKLSPFIGPPLRESFMCFYGLDEACAEEAVAKYREWFAPKGIFQNEVYPGIGEMLEELKAAGKVLAVASSKPRVFVEQILHHFELYDYFDVIVGSELDGTRENKEEVVEEALRQLETAGKAAGAQNAEAAGAQNAEAAGAQNAETVGGQNAEAAGAQNAEAAGGQNAKAAGAQNAEAAGGQSTEATEETENMGSGSSRTVMVGDRSFDIAGGKAHGLVTVGVTYGYAGKDELETAGADYLVDTVEELRRLLAR